MTRTATAVGLADRLASILNASPDGLTLVGERDRVIAWNRAMLTATGMTAEEIGAASLAEIEACLPWVEPDEIPTADDSAAASVWHDVVTGRDGRLFQRTEQRIDLSHVSSARLLCFRPFDIASESSDFERMQVRACSEQRRHALRMESVGRLAGGIAHDFNNMLTAMIGFAEQLEDEIGEHQTLRQVVRAAQTAADLTRQLLAFSRQQVLSPRVIDVAAVVEAMGGMVGRLIGDDVQLTIDAPKGLPSVLADPTQLEQIILNLAINARDAMARGGRLTMTVRRAIVTAARPGRAVQPAGEYVQLAVTDTGCGIAPELLNKVFEPFFTTKGMKGTGLGLSTVYGIVKQSGGFIWADSEPGVGTTFTIELPATHLPKEATLSPERFNGGLTRGAGERVLIVEDLEPVRTVTQEMLEGEGYRVTAAATPREALSIVRNRGEQIDLVLTDVMMPDMTGSELAAAIRVTRPQVPVLFMSGLPKAIESSNEPGSFLAKPFTRAMLLSHVRARIAAVPATAA